MKRTLLITAALCAVLSCVDATWTTREVSGTHADGSVKITATGLKHGAIFHAVFDDERVKGDGFEVGAHLPQFAPPILSFRWWGTQGFGVSVLIVAPVMVFVVCAASTRRFGFGGETSLGVSL